jgi:hypothetical protein
MIGQHARCTFLKELFSRFARLIRPSVLFSQNEPAISNQSAVLFSQNKPAPAIVSKVVVDPRAKMVSASSWGSRGSFTFEVVAVVARRAPDRTRILRDRSSTHKVLLTFFEDDGERRSSTGYGLFHGSFFSSPNVQS